MNKYCKSGLLFLFLMSSMFLSAQNWPDGSRIKALKIAFITERLSLSSSEAEQFWPIYNEFEDKRNALRERQKSEVYSKIGNAGNLTEAEAKALLNKYLEIEEEEEETDKEFYMKLANAISARKTLLLFSAEHDFRKRLIKEMRQRQGNRGN